MGTVERRAREKEELRAKILEAARELFVSDGYDAVTMRRIAERIEYSPTAIYLHFADKDALLQELCRTDFLAIAGDLGAIQSISDPLERLVALGIAYAEFGVAHPNQYRFMFMTPGLWEQGIDEKDLLQKGNPKEDAYALVRMAVSDAIATGRVREDLADPELLAQTMWAAMHGVIALEITMCKDTWVEWKPIADRIRALVSIIAAGIERREGA